MRQSWTYRLLCAAGLWVRCSGWVMMEADAACAIRSLDCDLRDASDDSLRRLKRVARYLLPHDRSCFCILKETVTRRDLDNVDRL